MRQEGEARKRQTHAELPYHKVRYVGRVLAGLRWVRVDDVQRSDFKGSALKSRFATKPVAPRPDELDAG